MVSKIATVSLAALMAPDPAAAAALRWSLSSEAEAPAAPPELRAAFEGLGVMGMDKTAVQAAFAQARRFAPWGA